MKTVVRIFVRARALAMAEPRLKIGGDAVAALSLAAGGGEDSDEQLKALARAAVSVTLGRATEEEALSGDVLLEDMDVEHIKKVYSALVCLVVEAAKEDLTSDNVARFLNEECGFSETKGQAIAGVFEEHKRDLRALLAVIGNHSYVPQLKGVDWGLEYCVATSEDRAVKELMYNISLKVADRAEASRDRIQFVCGVEELQDVVAMLKDACKSVERAM